MGVNQFAPKLSQTELSEAGDSTINHRSISWLAQNQNESLGLPLALYGALQTGRKYKIKVNFEQSIFQAFP